MSDNDDIERLLREVEGATSGATPAKRQESAPATTRADKGAGMALAISAVIGIIGVLLGFLPWVPGLWLGLGGFVGSWLGLTVYRRFG